MQRYNLSLKNLLVSIIGFIMISGIMSFKFSNPQKVKTHFAVGIVNEIIKGGCNISKLDTNKEIETSNSAESFDDLVKNLRIKYPDGKYSFRKYVVKPDQKVIIYSFTVQKPSCISKVIEYQVANSFTKAAEAIKIKLSKCGNCSGSTEIERWPRPY